MRKLVLSLTVIAILMASVTVMANSQDDKEARNSLKNAILACSKSSDDTLSIGSVSDLGIIYSHYCYGLAQKDLIAILSRLNLPLTLKDNNNGTVVTCDYVAGNYGGGCGVFHLLVNGGTSLEDQITSLVYTVIPRTSEEDMNEDGKGGWNSSNSSTGSDKGM